MTTVLREGPVREAAALRPPAARAPALTGRRTAAALALILGICAIATLAASRRNSTTFDEIVMMAAGARGFETGAFDMAPEHPPLTQYLYGLPVWLAQPEYPAETSRAEREQLGFSYRYLYARMFFWGAGNDPEKLAFLGRLMGALCAVLLVAAVFAFTRPRFGDGAALLAAALTAAIPDVLAHGGVAYNDVPLALSYFLAAWAIDAAVRRPTAARGMLAGIATAVAIGVKFSAIVLPGVALVLIGAETVARRDRVWRGRLALALLAGAAAGYLALVTLYRGDIALAEMRYGLDFTFRHVSEGHGTPGYLLGQTNREGWSYFFPLAFLYKTPAAFHVLLIIGLLGLSRSAPASAARSRLASPLRMPVVAGFVFLAALLGSNLVIGFRYALPALPLLCVIVAAGVSSIAANVGRASRLALAGLVLWMAASTLSFYPHFLAYTSEWGTGRDEGYRLLADSSIDWGQGLLELRDWMNREGVERVYLSYFGSAVPAGYGIEYVAMPSFFALANVGPPPDSPPRWLAISATNLTGVYLTGDPFARFRLIEPDEVLAHSILLYRVDEPGH